MGGHAGKRLSWGAVLTAAAATACASQGTIQEQATRQFEVRVPIGGQQLPGTLFVAEGHGPHPTLVWFHGFPGLPEPMPEAVDTLRDAGLNVLHVHYRGSWGTPGSFGPASALEDAAATLKFVRDSPADSRVDQDRIVTAGDSFGSWIALQAAAADPDVDCVAAALVLDLGRTGRDLASNQDMRTAFGGMFAQVAQDPALGFELAGGGASGLMAAIIDSQAQHDLRTLAPRLEGRPVLLIGAERDDLAPVDAHLVPVAEAFTAAGVDVSRAIVPGGHGIPDTDYAGMVADWVHGRCLSRKQVRQQRRE